VTDMSMARSILEAYIDEEQWNRMTKLKLADAEEALGKALGIGDKEARQQLNELLAGCLEVRDKAKALRVVRRK